MADRACMVLVKNNHILMVRQIYRGKEIWTFPGGRIEAGETPVAAAIRETREEVKLETKVVSILSQRAREDGRGNYYCYQGEVESGNVELGIDPERGGDEQELKEVKWVSIQELTQHPEVKKILPQLKLNSLKT